MPDRPEIVCICGSTRFVDEMRAANRDLTFAGVIVVAPGEADEAIRALLADPGIAYINAHNAAAGCFAARIERDGQ